MIADWWQNSVVKSLILKGIFLLFLLSGCAVTPSEPLAGLVFSANGKFGIKDAQTGYSASFSWRHYLHGYEIEVWGPLGQGRTRLQGNAYDMQVRRGDELLATGEPEQVMYSNLGWSVPIDILPAWLQGYPAVEIPHDGAVLDDTGRYTAFTQAGWQVLLQRYTSRGGAVDALASPGRIIASNGPRKVTVIVRDYAQ